MKRSLITALAVDYPVARVCNVLNFPRSSFYYPATPPEDAELRAALEKILAEFPIYGYRRLTAQLLRVGQADVNAKRVRRLLHEMGWMRPKKRNFQRTTQSGHGFRRFPNLVQDLEIDHPDQVWVADITFVRLRVEFVYLAVLMDVFTRSIRGWHLARTLEAGLTLTALERALAHGRPEIHHSDQGFHYASPTYVRQLEHIGCALSMAEVGAAWQNGYAERLMRTIKEEEVNLSEYRDYEDAYQQLGHFLDEVYMHKRIHSALSYLTPTEFESQWRA